MNAGPNSMCSAEEKSEGRAEGAAVLYGTERMARMGEMGVGAQYFLFPLRLQVRGRAEAKRAGLGLGLVGGAETAPRPLPNDVRPLGPAWV